MTTAQLCIIAHPWCRCGLHLKLQVNQMYTVLSYSGLIKLTHGPFVNGIFAIDGGWCRVCRIEAPLVTCMGSELCCVCICVELLRCLLCPHEVLGQGAVWQTECCFSSTLGELQWLKEHCGGVMSAFVFPWVAITHFDCESKTWNIVLKGQFVLPHTQVLPLADRLLDLYAEQDPKQLTHLLLYSWLTDYSTGTSYECMKETASSLSVMGVLFLSKTTYNPP